MEWTFQSFRIDVTVEYFLEQQKLLNSSLVFPVGMFRTDIQYQVLRAVFGE